MKILHICAGWEKWNGAANIARLIMGEQEREGHEVSFATWASIRQLRTAGEVWIHCGWLPCLWWAALCFSLTRRRRGAEKTLKWMPEACYDPMRLGYHGWKKWLVGPIERWFLRRCDRIIATCEAEKGWIQSYLGKRCPSIEVMDIKRFFNLNRAERVERVAGGDSFNTEAQRHRGTEIHLLYLGRRHPLKGLEYLEEAVRQIQQRDDSASLRLCVKIVSNVFGEEKEKVWEWCDVLVLPTLSENFGLVVAEALERSKRVITTDGAPAWGEEVKVKVKVKGRGEGEDGSHVERVDRVEGEVWGGYDGRLIYLKGYRDGSHEERVRLLKKAIEELIAE